jgi:hypothetical protein
VLGVAGDDLKSKTMRRYCCRRGRGRARCAERWGAQARIDHGGLGKVTDLGHEQGHASINQPRENLAKHAQTEAHGPSALPMKTELPYVGVFVPEIASSD